MSKKQLILTWAMKVIVGLIFISVLLLGGFHTDSTVGWLFLLCILACLPIITGAKINKKQSILAWIMLILIGAILFFIYAASMISGTTIGSAFILGIILSAPVIIVGYIFILFLRDKRDI